MLRVQPDGHLVMALNEITDCIVMDQPSGLRLAAAITETIVKWNEKPAGEPTH